MVIKLELDSHEVQQVLADYIRKNQTLGIEVKPEKISIEEDGSVRVVVSQIAGAGLAKEVDKRILGAS